MLRLKSKVIETKKTTQGVFTKLAWLVHRVDGNVDEWINTKNIQTSKGWIGILNKKTFEFSITRTPNSIFLRFFRLEFRGRITEKEIGSDIKFDIVLSGYLELIFIFCLLFSLFDYIWLSHNLSLLTGVLTISFGLSLVIAWKVFIVEKEFQDVFL